MFFYKEVQCFHSSNYKKITSQIDVTPSITFSTSTPVVGNRGHKFPKVI